MAVAGKKRKSTSFDELDRKRGPEKTCCFKQCSESTFTDSCSSVEVKTTFPHGFKKKKLVLAVSWSANGEAIFHEQCWKNLLKCARARSKKSVIKLANEEKELIKEANKTAEYHDSMERLKDSATRIGELILNAKHCVVFTGAGISTSAGIGWENSTQAILHKHIIL